MDIINQKCVVVMDEELPIGILINTAVILGMTLGKRMPEVIGPDVRDQSGHNHLGVMALTVPVLKGTKQIVKEIREKLYDDEFKDVVCVDFSSLGQGCKDYEEYTAKMALVNEGDLDYIGIALCGPKKKVNKLTGSMPLLR